MSWKAVEGALPVHGDGPHRRDWGDVEDNAEAILRVLERGQVGEVCDIGSGWPGPTLEITERVGDLVDERLGRPRVAVRVLIASVKDRLGHDRLYLTVRKKVRRELGSEPETSFEAELKRTIDWFVARRGGLRRMVSGQHGRSSR